MSGNLLGRETSPYLRQHADNPVHWRPWGPEALAEARRDNKPILLSIGYAACHWCHVMAHESFEDRETAEVMNRLFVNIKVDREERPDIDQIYMRALQALGEQGGWPLTMFLSPDAAPIWGGTYFPNTARFGRPAFVDVLRSVAHTFAEDPGRVAENRSALLDFLGQDPKNAETQPTLRSLDEAADLVASVFDPEYGGLRGAPKFPQPALLELMSRSAERTGKPEHRDHVHRTLRTMLQGGIYDHIGGGLARYSVDERWLVPHFEKMLYDNAQLIERLTQAWRQTGEALFRVRIEETVDWLMREMRVDGAFASSLDADSGEGEGSFTVWTPEEVAAVLGPESDQFRRIYDITEGGNFEGRSIPNRIANPGLLDDATEAGLTRMRAQLLQAREKRPRPGRDDKILTDWNGLLIAALASAATHFERRDWLDLAASTYQRLVDTVLVDGRLRHARHGDTVLPVGFASDYGAMLKAALALHQATQEQRYLTEASQFADVLDRHYWDQGISAYRLTADDADGLIVRPAPLIDDSIPSANGVIAAGLCRLTRLSGTQAYRDRSARILEAHCGAPSEALGKAGLYNALDEHLAGLDIVLIAPQGSNVELLKRAAILHAGEAATLTILADTESLATGHPAAGKTALDERPTAYVCQGNTCSLPVTEPDALVRLLKQRTG